MFDHIPHNDTTQVAIVLMSMFETSQMEYGVAYSLQPSLNNLKIGLEGVFAGRVTI